MTAQRELGIPNGALHCLPTAGALAWLALWWWQCIQPSPRKPGARYSAMALVLPPSCLLPVLHLPTALWSSDGRL